jgi:hypothetical protein
VLFAFGGPRKRGMFGVVAAALTGFVALSVLSPVAAVADEEDPLLAPVRVELRQDVSPEIPDAVEPGELVTYIMGVACSSLETDCIDLQVTDTLPDPLVLQSVTVASGSGAPDAPTATSTITGNAFTVTLTSDLGGGNVGMVAGASLEFTVIARVPLDTSADWDDQTVVNTATATVSNRESGDVDAVSTLLSIPTVLSSTIDLGISPTTVPGITGTVVTMTVEARNTSNRATDTLTLQLPGSTTNLFDYAAITGLTVSTWPTGADLVQVDWLAGASATWNLGTPQATAALPSGVTASTLKGLRLTFSSSSGGIARDARAVVAIAGALRSAVTAINPSASSTAAASSWVSYSSISSSPVSDSASLTINRVTVNPVATKTFTAASLVGGRNTRVTLTGSNSGNFALSSMTIQEPADGTDTLDVQGLGFVSWDAARIEWPVGASAASVRFLYADAAGVYGSAQNTATRNTLPEPEVGRTVIGFRVTFTGTSMPPGQYATVPYIASTAAVAADVTTSSTMSLAVVTTTAETASTTASADLTRRTARVNTTVDKLMQPGTIYSVPGAFTVISLPAGIDDVPTGPADPDNPTGSTVGATRFVVSDTGDPATDPFWDSFDVAAVIATDVPSGATMSVEFWDGVQWLPIDAAATGIAGPATWGRVFTSGERAAFGGIRFVFEPADGETELPPGFSVQPNIKAVLRDTLRSDAGTIASARETDSAIDNAVLARVENPAATPEWAQFEHSEALSLLGIPSGGGGGGAGSIDLITKTWSNSASTGEKSVLARSNDRISATLAWGTGGLPFESVTITDSAADGDGDPQNPAGTVFEAFDLVRIPAIGTSADPLLRYDRVAAVQLFYAGAWHDAIGNPCAANACDGTFPGYTLTADERRDATGVRLVIEESPTRAARIGSIPTAPLVGSGVAATMSQSRHLTLEFELRDTRRSNGEAVLGLTRGALYNSTAGIVVNSASIVAVAEGGSERRDEGGDAVSIIDRAINALATKTWTDGPLGIPPLGTPQALYPKARLVISAQNSSTIKVNELSIAEPSGGTTPFEYVNLARIVSITVPSGATASTVTLAPLGSFTIAEAIALTATELADVTSIEVVHEGRIAPSARTTVTMDTQLRSTVRTSGAAMSTVATPGAPFTIDNTALASVTDPAGLSAPTSGSDNVASNSASATMQIAAFEYGAVATKSIVANTTATALSPAIQYSGSSAKATVSLSGRPTGNVRTTRMVIEDSSPTFWNAYRFDAFTSSPFAFPINTVQVEVLTDVTYELDGATLVAKCDGSTDLADCWHAGAPSSTLALPTVPGVTKDDIRGIRLTFTRSDYAAWERPYNPEQFVNFTVDRRSTLVWTPAGTTTPVPSTLYIFPDAAPGETARATFTNQVEVTVDAAEDAADLTPLWSANDSDVKAITYQHLPARIEVRKGPFGGQTLGSAIPFAITIKNTGATGDKPLAGLVVLDHIQGDAQGPLLEIPEDPDTGLPYTADLAFSYTLKNAAGVTQPTPAIVATIGTASPAGQDLEFRMPSGATLPVGWTLTINTPLEFRAQLVADTPVNNSVVVTSDQEFDACDRYDNAATAPTSQQTFVEECGAQTTVRPLPSAPMTIIKGVRGVDAGPLADDGTSLGFDDLGILKTQPTNPTVCDAGPNITVNATGYYRYPCVPITRPGGTEEWIAKFTNSGNVPVAKVVAIDLLPTGGDTGVIINESRGSKWTPKLSQYPVLTGAPDGSTLTVYYTKTPGVATPRCNAADIQFTMGMDADSNPSMSTENLVCLDSSAHIDDLDQRDWAELSPAATAEFMADIVALKFVVTMPTGLAPGSAIAVSYRSLTAAQVDIAESDANLGRDSVAYNSIAGAAVGIGTDADSQPIDLAYRFVTEPRKVGVALATGQVRLLKTVDGTATSFAPSTFALSLSCVSAGDPITLTSSTGALRSPFTVTPGTELLVKGIPLYAQCTVSEDTNYGQTAKAISPEVVRAEAAHDALTGSTVSNPRPAFGSANRPAIELSSVTNTYTSASLTITKTVDNGGAVNQSGGAISYLAAAFTVACTFDRGTGPQAITLASGDASFSLSHDGTKTITGLVAGAVCTVTETNVRGAQTTTTVVTQNGTDGPVTTGTARVITLAPAANTAAYTNTYGLSSITLRKTVAGDAANTWGNQSFTINVTCTNSNASPTTVWNQNITLTKSGTTQIADHLVSAAIAGGSSCRATESGANDGGATSTSISPSASTATATGASRTFVVTNTFSNASLTVSKTVQTPALDEELDPVYVADSFDFTVQCTWEGQTVLALTSFSLDRVGTTSRTFSDLPAGASCTVTETGTGGADSTTIVTRNGTVNATTATTTLVAGTNTAAVTNNYAVSSFTVTKDSVGGASAQYGQGPFTIHVSCTAPGGASAFEADLSLADGASRTIENLPDGSTCAATEADNLGADDTTTAFEAGDLVSGDTVTVTKTNPGHVTISNWYLTGALTVTKSVSGDADDFGVGPFTIAIECVRDGIVATVTDPERELEPGAMSTTFTGLPSGASCTVSESDSAGASSSFISTDGTTALTTDVRAGHAFEIVVNPTSHVDDQAQADTVHVVNRYDDASIVVTKTITSAAVDQAGTAIGYGPFPVSVTCTFEGATIYESPAGTELEAGTPFTVPDLVRGASCTITETDDMDAVRTTVDTQVGLIGSTRPGTAATILLVSDDADGSRNLVEFDNEYDTGSITLAKTLDGDDDWAPASYRVTLVCELDDASGTRTVWDEGYDLVAGDDPIELDGIAAGAQCTVTEESTGGANETVITVDGTSTAGTSASFVMVADETLPVAVQNTFTLATVTVVKERTGGWDLWGDGPFEVSLSCTREVDTRTETITIPGGAERTLASPSYSAEYAGLPLDADCTITETRTGGATSSTIPAPFAVAAVDTEVTVSNDFAEGAIEVTKEVDGDGSLLYGEGPFIVTLECTRVVDGDSAVPVMIPGGSTRTLDEHNGYVDSFTRLPAGAECQLTETGTGGATVSAAAVDVTVVADDTAAVTLTNEFLLGKLIVTNRVTGTNGPANEHHVFMVELTCVLDVNGEEREIEIPGGAEREILHLETIEYLDLPVGARCELLETVTNNAEEVTIEPGVDSSGVSRRTMATKTMTMQLTTLAIGLDPVRFDVVNVYTLALPNTGAQLPPVVPLGLAGLLIASVGVAVVAADRRRRRA